MINKKTFLFFLVYAVIRVYSFYFEPGTALNSALTIALILLTGCLLYKKNDWGWFIVTGEIILGGTGGFLQLASITLRSWLFAISMGLFLFRSYRDKAIADHHLNNKRITYPLSLLFLVVGGSILRGQFAGHNPKLIITEIIPYLFLLYYFPLKELVNSEKFAAFAINALSAAIIANLLFVLFTFTGFSGGFFHLQGEYYHWFRDISNGKITDLGMNFYRIVLDEHLLIIPILIFFIYQIIHKTKSAIAPCPFILTPLLLIILSVNLTRIYILALLFGMLILFSRTLWKRWLIISLLTLIFFCISFTAIHLVASWGRSFGWEVFGLRLESIASPELEESSLSRILLIPKIFEHIYRHPILGNGLGDTVSVFSPTLNATITTSQFDWGYLQIWDELGLLGIAAWAALIASLFIRLRKHKLIWQTGSFAVILLINITSPALFHVLGIIWMTFLYASSSATQKQIIPAHV